MSDSKQWAEEYRRQYREARRLEDQAEQRRFVEGLTKLRADRRRVAERVAEAVREMCANEAGKYLEGEWADEGLRSIDLAPLIDKLLEEE